jgi:hypothetical protein
MGRKLVVKELEVKAAINNHREVVRVHTEHLKHHEGAMEMLQYIRRTFVDGEHDAEIDIDAMIPEVPAQKAPPVLPEAPTRVPDIDPVHAADYRPNASGLLLPRSKGNSGDHHPPG